MLADVTQTAAIVERAGTPVLRGSGLRRRAARRG